MIEQGGHVNENRQSDSSMNRPLLAAGVVICLVLGALMWLWSDRIWPELVMTPVLLAGFHFYSKVNISWKRLIVLLTAITVVVYGAVLAGQMRQNLNTHPEWDFHLFWVFGQASSHGLNPYEQANLLPILEPLSPSQDLLTEFYFFHAPPTLFLFAPLGWFNYDTALLVWFIILSVNLLGDVVLLWRLFLRSSGYYGLLLVAAITFMCYATRLNFLYAQLNFLLLLSVLLFWFFYPRMQSGLGLTLGIITKPIMLVGFLFLVLRRRWKIIASCLAGLAVLSLATILVYGSDMFFQYFKANPISQSMPNSLYSEIVNQSLLATILRVTHADLTSGSPLFNPLFLGTSLILTAITAYIVYRLDEAQWEWGMALTVVLGLLLFPKTLSHYSLLLLVPMFLLWRERDLLPGKHWTAIVMLTAMQLMIHIQSGGVTFGAILLAFIAVAGVGLLMLHGGLGSVVKARHAEA